MDDTDLDERGWHWPVEQKIIFLNDSALSLYGRINSQAELADELRQKIDRLGERLETASRKADSLAELLIGKYSARPEPSEGELPTSLLRRPLFWLSAVAYAGLLMLSLVKGPLNSKVPQAVREFGEADVLNLVYGARVPGSPRTIGQILGDETAASGRSCHWLVEPKGMNRFVVSFGRYDPAGKIAAQFCEFNVDAAARTVLLRAVPFRS